MAWILEDLRKGTKELLTGDSIDYEEAARLALGDDSADLDFAYDQDNEVCYYIWDDPCDGSPGGYVSILRGFRLGSWLIVINRHFSDPVDLYYLLTPVEKEEA